MNIGILISGRGSNMVALVDAVKSGEIPASEVAVVISDKADAAGLAKAKERGVETVVIERNGRTRDEHDTEIIGELKKRGVELVCLAGYMRLLSPSFIHAFPNQIINIHPSLLPAFPGLDAQKQAFEHGVKVTGCTVHFVDENLDSGDIILQRAIYVRATDTLESLSARILNEEHIAYVEAVRRITNGRVQSPDAKKNLDYEHLLTEILDVGIDTSMHGEGISLREALHRVDYKNSRRRLQSSDLLQIIKKDQHYIDDWIGYSEDKRTSGGWWIIEHPPGIGYLKTGERISFSSIEEAVAEYVIRELDFWDTLRD